MILQVSINSSYVTEESHVLTVSHVLAMSHVAEIVAANRLLAGQVIWKSIYSPRSSRRKSDCFNPKKALLHNSSILKRRKVPLVLSHLRFDGVPLQGRHLLCTL